MHNFKKLDIWNKSVAFVSDIYRLVSTFLQTERFGLVSQMQRAAISIPPILPKVQRSLAIKILPDFSKYRLVQHLN